MASSGSSNREPAASWSLIGLPAAVTPFSSFPASPAAWASPVATHSSASRKIRPTSAMDGVPLAAHRDELKSGVAAIDLESGTLVGTVEFQTAVEETFDVQILSGIRFPEVVGF